MIIPQGHKKLLIDLGIRAEDFRLFDGESVTYEYDPGRGVRLFDPYYRTSYQEFIDVDGWSSWSIEKDTFMSDLLRETRAEVERLEAVSEKPSHEEIAKAMQKRLGRKVV